ncbi:hypothetical protein A374_17854 [Fictibacillus macauensis ZFHKF-1]|uniref:Uncharacterized protein n=1 Tax=Fictibacillus macauensis ZFHKF-1 TaxID=1196324 RepID=I8AEZ3_9BACL|nr:hypothetical protein [Fictibacillus macauensis]EIT83924.1 hypothetical protein A374_17854 [Fictibacillus macauensis ZFHKF-1]
MTMLPIPSTWGISANVGGMPLIWGTMYLATLQGNQLTGSINFRGAPIPLSGYYSESTQQVMLESPYAEFTGTVFLYEDPSINIRHFVINGRVIMKPSSQQAGQGGTWIASTDIYVPGLSSQPQQYESQLPPVGAFTTSDYLSHPDQRKEKPAE